MPRTLIMENEFVMAFESIAPVSEIHILVIPKAHISTFLDIENKEVMHHLTSAAQEIIWQKKIESGYKLVINGGKYQAVKHLHLHLLGGKLEDERDVLNNT